MRPRGGWLALTLAAALAVAPPASPGEVALREILAEPQRFDGQTVTLRGSIQDLKLEMTRKGTPYYTFHLVGDGQAVLVFSLRRPACASGGAVVVDGWVQLARRAGQSVLSHLEAVTVTCGRTGTSP